MPKPKDGQSKSEYISYCISYIKNNESDKADWSSGRLYKHCEGLWNKYKATDEIAEALVADGYIPTAFKYSELKFMKLDNGKINMSDMQVINKNDRKYTVVDAVACVGDRFYGRVYVPSDILRATASMWNNTYNDLSHLGTAFPAGLGAIENLEYITGYNSDAKFDESINAVRIKMHINHNAPKFQAWKNFMEVSNDAGRIPNVSIFGFAKYKAVKPEDLPKNVKMSDDKLVNGYVIVMADLIPFAVTTCLKGKCDDAAGCGICNSEFKKEDWNKIENSCKDGTCEVREIKDPETEDNKESEGEKKPSEADKKLHKYYENRLKELNGER